MNRRQFLKGCFAAGALGAFSLLRLGGPTARASSHRYLLIYWNGGGWDPTFVFDPHFEASNVARDSSSVPAEVGGITFADAESRPSVRSFFERYGAQTLVINGIAVGSISHDNCSRLMLTGSNNPAAPDLPTIVASETGGSLPLPHVVLTGPRFSGTQGAVVAPLNPLMAGTVAGTEPAGVTYSPQKEERLRQYLEGEVAARLGQGGSQPLLEQYGDGLSRLRTLTEHASAIQIPANPFPEQLLEVGLTALSSGLTRSLMWKGSLPNQTQWDSHFDNRRNQDLCFEGTFAALQALLAKLETLPAPEGGSLASRTVVLCLSEMGRAPVLNSAQGKDHWPYTSAMLIGPDIQGGRVVGATDGTLLGKPVDLATGMPSTSGQVLTPGNVWVGLLEGLGVDPSPWFPGVAPLGGMVG